MPIASQTGDGVAGTLTNPTPPVDALAAPPPALLEEPIKEEPKEKDPFDELLENLETAGLTDKNFSDEEDLEVSLDDDLSIEAQMMPLPSPMQRPSAPISHQPAPQPLPVEDGLEVSLPEEATVDEAPSKDIDAILEGALANVSIADIIKKVEGVNSIFQNRTIVRELSIVDLMLANLGLSSYFTNLSEIIQKNHEASNYSISRLSDILTKLRGAITDDDIKSIEPSGMSPEIQQVQQKLEQQKKKEEQRKEMRKQLENDSLEEKPEQPALQALPEQPTQPQMQPNEEIAQAPTQLIQ